MTYKPTPASIILPYVVACLIISSVVPSALIEAKPLVIGSTRKKNMTPITTPTINAVYVINENVLFALSSFFSPNLLETKAAPPLPNMNPRQATAIMTGKIKLTPANADVPTTLETKKPSTIQYMEVNSIIKIGPKVNFRIFLYVK